MSIISFHEDEDGVHHDNGELEIDVDEFMTQSGMVSEDTFMMKICLNALAAWTGSYSDESYLRLFVDKAPVRHRHKWIPEIRKLEEEYNAKNDYTSAYTAYSKFIDRDIIQNVILAPIYMGDPSLSLPFQFSKTCETLSALLDLSHCEKLFLQIALECKYCKYPFDHLFPRIGSLFEHKDKRFAALFGVDIALIKEAMNGFLFKSGFIVPSSYPEGFITISPVFGDAFDDDNLTPETIEEVIFPQTLTTNLAIDDFKYVDKEINRTERIIQKSLTENGIGTNILLWGPAGTGKTEMAVMLAKKNGWKIRSIGDISEVDATEKSRAQRITNLKIALKLYASDSNTILLFDEIEDLFKQDINAAFSKAFINRIIETTPVPIIWTTNSLIEVGAPVLRRMTYNIHCTTPPKEARRPIWEKYAGEFGVTLTDVTRIMLDEFDISPALIKNTMRVTGAALTGECDDDEVKDIVISLDRLVHYGHKRKFDEPKKEDALYDASCVNTDHDLDTFTDKLIGAKSKAFTLLLHGVPGSGKSAYGHYLADKLDKKVLFKRASDLMSKWLGESEQLIAAAFEEAKKDKKVLLIDEGDSFLRNREKAEHSWEISQVNEMLSQMENHPEPFIITTNLMSELDSASMRRFSFKLKFDFMTPQQAMRLFHRYFGVDAPVDIMKNYILAPGDFANVKKQVDILGIDDPHAIYRLLRDECDLKPQKQSLMGF